MFGTNIFAVEVLAVYAIVTIVSVKIGMDISDDIDEWLYRKRKH